MACAFQVGIGRVVKGRHRLSRVCVRRAVQVWAYQHNLLYQEQNNQNLYIVSYNKFKTLNADADADRFKTLNADADADKFKTLKADFIITCCTRKQPARTNAPSGFRALPADGTSASPMAPSPSLPCSLLLPQLLDYKASMAAYASLHYFPFILMFVCNVLGSFVRPKRSSGSRGGKDGKGASTSAANGQAATANGHAKGQ